MRIDKLPSPSGEELGVGPVHGLLAQHLGPTPTQCRVNSAPRCSGHAGGMTGPALLKGRG